MTGRELAAALGISEQMVSRLRKRGMPTDSIERAERWRRRHLEWARMKQNRALSAADLARSPATPPRPARAPAEALACAVLDRLADGARAAAGTLGAESLDDVALLAHLALADARLEPAIRAALRAVLPPLRPEAFARLPEALVLRLAAPVVAAIAAAADDGGGAPAAEPVDDDDTAAELLYCVIADDRPTLLALIGAPKAVIPHRRAVAAGEGSSS